MGSTVDGKVLSRDPADLLHYKAVLRRIEYDKHVINAWAIFNKGMEAFEQILTLEALIENFSPVGGGFVRLYIDSDGDLHLQCAGPKSLLVWLFRILLPVGVRLPKVGSSEHISLGGSGNYYAHATVEGCDGGLFVSYTGTQCERIEIGREMQEVIKYETICH